jgi:hypothetical protein
MSTLHLPDSPTQLLEQLCAIVPSFQGEHDPDCYSGSSTFHSILIDFTCFFGTACESLTQQQLQMLGLLASAAVEDPGSAEPSSR